MSRLSRSVFLSAFVAPALLAQSTLAPPACSGKYSPACNATESDQKAAHKDFERGLKLQHQGRFEEALADFRAASELVPRNVDYATARELARQALVNLHLRRGNDFLVRLQSIEAMAQFREALALDPDNVFAAARLQELARDPAPQRRTLQVDDQPGRYVELEPQPGVRSFHLRTDTRNLLQQVAAQYGIKADVQPELPSLPVRFDLENVDFTAAMEMATTMAHAFWTAIAPNEIVVAPDEPQSRQRFERFALRTIYVPGGASPQDLNDLTNALRTLFEARFLSVATNQNAIILRAPRPVLEEASQFLQQLHSARPEVMLELHVYQVSQTTLRQLGMDLPTQFQMFNLPAAALLLNNPNVQQLINQLITSGAINQANFQGIQALLSQLQNQQLSSIFKNPFATFGGGISRFGVGIPPATLRFALNKSSVSLVDNLTLRARQGDLATFRIGSRYPILNASFAPIFNSAAITQVLGNNSFIAPFPSFSYEDIGLTVKATPAIHEDRAVTLKLETSVRSLSSTSLNGIPVISNREYSGVITVKNEETAVIIGSVSQQDQRSIKGIPGIAGLPGIGYLAGVRTKNVTEDELIITLTPHVVRAPEDSPAFQVLAH
jgi:general secretion pathway protein D